MAYSSSGSGSGGAYGFWGSLYSTNDLWLEITSLDFTNQFADLLVHNTQESKYYQLQSKSNLLQSAWELRSDSRHGDPGTNTTLFASEPLAGQTNLFFRAQQADWYVYVYAAQDAFEPQTGMPGQDGFFDLVPILASSSVTNDLTVRYTMSGTASNGVDYTLLTGTVVVTNTGVNSVATRIVVRPLADSLIEGIETVTLTVMPTNTFILEPSAYVATLQISDSSTTVSVSATLPSAVEPDGPPGAPAVWGQFMFQRDDFRGIYTNRLTVAYRISGTASNSLDYSNLTGTITFAPGDTQTNLDIIPLKDNFAEGVETVSLTLYPTNNYRVDASQSNAIVNISDSSTKISITLGQNAIEPGISTNLLGQVGYVTVSRSDARGINSNLTVNYIISGTASNGIDYVTLSGSATFASGEESTNIYVKPFADNLIEGAETVVFTALPGNGYLVDASTSSTTVSIADTATPLYVVTNFPSTMGIDYHAPLNSLIVSSYNGGKFWRIYTNLVVSNSVVMTNVVVTNWSGVQGLPGEVKLTTVKSNVNGFTNGDLYFTSGFNVGWLSADGTRSNLNWCNLTNNSAQLYGFCVDQTGVWNGDLITASGSSSPNFGDKGVWRINSNHQATLVTNFTALNLEGAIALPNDVAKWGPWAGKIITGDEDQDPALIFTIATNGIVTTYDTRDLIPEAIPVEDLDIIPANQDFYACDESGIVKLPRTAFTNFVGDLLITGEHPGKIFIVHWDSTTTNFVVHATTFKHPNGSLFGFEHATFAPINLPTR